MPKISLLKQLQVGAARQLAESFAQAAHEAGSVVDPASVGGAAPSGEDAGASELPPSRFPAASDAPGAASGLAFGAALGSELALGSVSSSAPGGATPIRS